MIPAPSGPTGAGHGLRGRAGRAARCAGASLALLASATSWDPAHAQGSAFKVVVNESNPVSSLPVEEVSKLFLKKAERWEDGFRASPVDQRPERRVRMGFSRAIHGKDVDAVRKYWRKMAFSGLGTPPQELESDAAVLDFVAHNVGGVGYVSGSAELVDRVKVLEITGLEGK